MSKLSSNSGFRRGPRARCCSSFRPRFQGMYLKWQIVFVLMAASQALSLEMLEIDSSRLTSLSQTRLKDMRRSAFVQSGLIHHQRDRNCRRTIGKPRVADSFAEQQHILSKHHSDDKNFRFARRSVRGNDACKAACGEEIQNQNKAKFSGVFRVGTLLLILGLPRMALAAAGAPTVPASLIAEGDVWTLWLVLLSTATAGLMAERTKLGAALSSPLVTMLMTLALCNLGVIPFDAPLYSSVNRFLVPMAVPLLLFGADLRRRGLPSPPSPSSP